MYGFLDEGEGIIKGAPYLAAGCVFVASAAEEFGRHLVAWEVIDAAEGEADARVLGVFAKEDGELHAEDLEGEVDEAFGVAIEDAEAASFGVGEGHDSGVGFLPYVELDVEHVAHELHAVRAIGEENVAVDFVFVDAEAEEEADELVDLGTGAGVGEGAGVGHHASVEADGFVVGEEGDSRG